VNVTLTTAEFARKGAASALATIKELAPQMVNNRETRLVPGSATVSRGAHIRHRLNRVAPSTRLYAEAAVPEAFGGGRSTLSVISGAL